MRFGDAVLAGLSTRDIREGMQSLWDLLAKAVGQSLQGVADLAPSRASPLPPLGCISRLEPSCTARSNAAAPRIPSPNSDQDCGSGLARESGGSVAEEGGWSTAFASKPAPTFGMYFKVRAELCLPLRCRRSTPNPKPEQRSKLWERACSRKRWVSRCRR